MSPLATTGPSVLWYLARGSGLAALVVLTFSVVLGIVTSVRWTNPRWPRFVVELLHRNASLLGFGLIAVHIVTVVVDAFAPIGWKDTVIPFVSVYRPVWLGLGAAAFDVLVAILVTSLLRHRLSHSIWRFVHWFSYLCWPLVVLHGLGTGSDTKVGFVLSLYIACIAAVILAAWWRLAVGWPDHVGVRIAGLSASVLAPILLVVWLAAGPLAAGWSRRAGTPANLLARTMPTANTPASPTPNSTAATAPSSTTALPTLPFTAQLAGTIAQSNPNSSGDVTVRLLMRLSGGATGQLDVALSGQPLEGGGVLENASVVTLGPNGHPGLYRGTVTRLQGNRIVAALQSPGRSSWQLTIDVQPDPASNRVTGTTTVQVATGGAGQEGGQ